MLVIISAVAVSIKGIFAKMLYAYGLDPMTLLALRYSIALPMFWGLIYLYPSDKITVKDHLLLILSGILGLYLAGIADFYGLLYIDVSLERTILYSYPSMVVLLTAFLFKERIDARKVFAIVLTYGGLLLSVKIYKSDLRVDMFGAGLVFLAALVYALGYLLTASLSKRISAVKISAYSTTAVTFAFLGTWHGTSVPNEPKVWVILFLIALISTFIPVVALTVGIKRIGASKAAIVSSIGPVSTAMLAYLILGERMELAQSVGMALVIGGVMVVSSGKETKEAKK